MILHTGNRTDIPAFYSRWFAERLKAGFVLVRNPYDPSSVTRYEINTDVVDLIAFCTKNPAPMFQYMDLLAPYKQYWHVTMTPYGKEIEPNAPDKAKVINDFKWLSETIGINSVGWRYDPIFIDDNYTVSRHLERFEEMAEQLRGYADVCVISFIDLYQKVLRNFSEVRRVSRDDMIYLGKEMVSIGKKYGIAVKTCAEGDELAPFGVDCSGCMTAEVFEKAIGCRLQIPSGFKSSRSECACILGSDIGQYDTCGHLCRYCYANCSREAVKRNMKLHDFRSPFLVGNSLTGDKIHQARQESWLDMQLSF